MISPESFLPYDHEAVVVPGSGVVKPTLSGPDLFLRPAGVYVGVGGNLVMTLAGARGGAVTYAVVAGQVVLGEVGSIDHTTTASGLVFLYLSAV